MPALLRGSAAILNIIHYKHSGYLIMKKNHQPNPYMTVEQWLIKVFRKTFILGMMPVPKVYFSKFKFYNLALVHKYLLKDQFSKYHNIFSQLNGSADK